jgi:hypothetical protein
MQTYALIRDGVVAEIVKVPANTPPIDERFHPDIVAASVLLTTSQAKAVQEGWLYEGEGFAAPPDPGPAAPTPRTCTPREFMDRFEDEEEDRITVKAAQAAAAGHPRLQRFLNRLIASTVVELDHPELKAGMDEVVAAELLTRERADAILAA